MKIKNVVVGVVVLLLLCAIHPVVKASSLFVDRGCNISKFELLSPGPNFSNNESIRLILNSNCGASQFYIDSLDRIIQEFTTPNKDDFTINTKDIGTGSHNICVRSRGEGGWENADVRCVQIHISDPAPAPTQKPAQSTNSEQNSSNNQQEGCFYHMVLNNETIPDDTIMKPGQHFTKTWNVYNDSNCPWLSDFSFKNVNGKNFNASPIKLGQTVDMGSSVNISINMIAPTNAGTFESTWQLFDPYGNAVKGKPFVRIIVNESASEHSSQNTESSSATNSSSNESGGIDVLGYCRSIGYNNAFPNKKQDANSWICESANDQKIVDMNQACIYNYSIGYEAVLNNITDPYSWKCVVKSLPPTPTVIPTSTSETQQESNEDNKVPDNNTTCTRSIQAYYDPDRGGEIIAIPLSPLPGEFTINYNNEVVENSDWGIRHDGYAGPSTESTTYLGIGKRWIVWPPSHWSWNNDDNWLISYMCP